MQLSYESWEPTGGADGATHVERLVDGFAAPLLQRWRKLDVNHSPVRGVVRGVSGGGIERHRDVYRVVLENEAASKAEPATLVSALKRELVAFAASLASVVPPNELRVCRAADGNVLEAINLTLNVLEKHYMDRDVQRTGNSIVLISAGSGVFAVDARLARVTKQRMMDNGIGGMDAVGLAWTCCLRTMARRLPRRRRTMVSFERFRLLRYMFRKVMDMLSPLHTAPIFMHRGINNTKATAYEVPHWINLSFVDPERAADALAWVAAAAPRRARDGWRMARLDLLTTEPEEEELKPVVDQEQQVRLRALAQRRRRVPDLLAHFVGAELDTSQPPLQRPRRFIQQKKSSRDRQESVSFGSPGNLAQSLGHASNEDASSLASSAGAPWRPWLHLGSPSDSGVSLSWRDKSTPDETPDQTHRRTPSMLSEEDDEALPYAYDVAASFAGSLSTTASKSPPVSRRTLSGSQQRPRQLARRPQPPTPAPEDLAAKFDAHDMMAYYGDPADETPHIKPSRTITGEFGSPPQESSFLARSQPPDASEKRGVFWRSDHEGPITTEAHPGRGFTRGVPKR